MLLNLFIIFILLFNNHRYESSTPMGEKEEQLMKAALDLVYKIIF